MMSQSDPSADSHGREVCESMQLPDGYYAICHRDTSRGGVEVDDAGFLLEPFGECVLTDSPVDLADVV